MIVKKKNSKKVWKSKSILPVLKKKKENRWSTGVFPPPGSSQLKLNDGRERPSFKSRSASLLPLHYGGVAREREVKIT